ncbi:metal ABC transporter solute-binding protein, Zn/Mn family [Paenibacillus xylaniclasticus]|uniref:metal ABC transporter solute-binding protein, Zn/Mn family n=1 Tax=Paenibacillus xylaniclasticus TaxID=588083 RepID=UPI000FD9C45B|nr:MULTISPECIES: zinc ABC transporter substrate-binding protein [Paenibacillus]GFN30520.1 ABC transporter substrate-binding protein [Paenibacillus curdlanolyticus]
MDSKQRSRGRLSILRGLTVVAAAVLILSGCGSGASTGKLAEDKTNVVTSFYPLYYLASEIGGEYTNVINLIPAGVEPHDWSPKSRDLDTASKAQLLLYNGAGLEGWIDDFLEGLPKSSKLKTGAASEGIVLLNGEGEEDEHESEAADHEDHDHHGIDPHTWVSPKSMIIMAGNVKDMLIEVDTVHQAQYAANYEKLIEKLNALDVKFETELSQVSRRDIVVSHQAFGYLARDYGLNVLSIMGLSPDSEPRAQDLLELSKFVKKNGVRYIFFEELVSSTLADTLAREADVDTLVLNPVEGLTSKQKKNGDDYVTLMESNLQNLLKALQ